MKNALSCLIKTKHVLHSSSSISPALDMIPEGYHGLATAPSPKRIFSSLIALTRFSKILFCNLLIDLILFIVLFYFSHMTVFSSFTFLIQILEVPPYPQRIHSTTPSTRLKLHMYQMLYIQCVFLYILIYNKV